MRKTLITVAVIAIIAAPAMGGVIGSKHDLTSAGSGSASKEASNVTQVCVFCHTPHQPSGTSTDPLWNHSLSTNSTYGVYASDTLNSNPTEVGGATHSNASVSNLCLSCHDGTIGLGSLWNDPNNGGTPDNSGDFIAGPALLGTDLTNDHPINMTYDSALATEDKGGASIDSLKTPTSSAWVDASKTVPLFSSKVQCASCHDPHADNYTPFLVKSNAASALCDTCHNK